MIRIIYESGSDLLSKEGIKECVFFYVEVELYLFFMWMLKNLLF